MDKQRIDEIKKRIKESHLTDETKTQLLSLMDFINYPEVKERILRIIELEEKVTDLEVKYLKEMDRRFRESDLFGYDQKAFVIPTNTRKQMENKNPSMPSTVMGQQIIGSV
jgi:hypothetical protein